MAVHVGLDLANVMRSRIGRQHGISEKQLAVLQYRTRNIHLALQRGRESGALAFYDLPYMRESVIEVVTYAAEQIGRFENFVHVATGCAAAGARALHTALNHPFHNYFTAKDRGGYPRVFFIERADPDALAGLLDILDVGETLFNIVQPAPGRPGPIRARPGQGHEGGQGGQSSASFLVFLDALKKRLGSGWKSHVVFTTDASGGDLQAVARAERIKTFVIHPGLGEYFSVLSPTGLLPAALSGIDVHGLLHGAAEMEKACRGEDVLKNPGYLFGAAHYLLHVRKGKSTAVMVPGADCLADLAAWFRQLWVECVESKYAPDQVHAPTGGTPAKAQRVRLRRGQGHFDEGRSEVGGSLRNVVTFLTLGKFRHHALLPAEFGAYESFRAVGGKSVNQLLQAEQRAAMAALTAARQPNLTITLPALRPETVGEFIFMMEVAAVYAGELCARDELRRRTRLRR